jgi:hypothetical protein
MTALARLLLVVLVAAPAGCGDDEPPAPLSVTWGLEGGACAYDAADRTVTATLKILTPGSEQDRLTVTVTAHADENTSMPVGSGTRTVHGGGDAPRTFEIRFPVTEAPFVGEDDVIACSIETKSQDG